MEEGNCYLFSAELSTPQISKSRTDAGMTVILPGHLLASFWMELSLAEPTHLEHVAQANATSLQRDLLAGDGSFALAGRKTTPDAFACAACRLRGDAGEQTARNLFSSPGWRRCTGRDCAQTAFPESRCPRPSNPIQPRRVRRENRVRAARDGWPVLGPVLRWIEGVHEHDVALTTVSS